MKQIRCKPNMNIPIFLLERLFRGYRSDFACQNCTPQLSKGYLHYQGAAAACTRADGHWHATGSRGSTRMGRFLAFFRGADKAPLPLVGTCGAYMQIARGIALALQKSGQHDPAAHAAMAAAVCGMATGERGAG